LYSPIVVFATSPSRERSPALLTAPRAEYALSVDEGFARLSGTEMPVLARLLAVVRLAVARKPARSKVSRWGSEG
jgi:hypothetical protein